MSFKNNNKVILSKAEGTVGPNSERSECSFGRNGPRYKSASILPYRYKDGEYFYLLCMEKDGDWCSSFGGHMEPIDKNSYWIAACRELGEELYGLKPDPEASTKYQKRVRKNALTKRIVVPFPQRKHTDFMCHWKRILLKKTTPEELVEDFEPNDEIKSIHWVKAEDLWEVIGEVSKYKGPFKGPKAKEFWVPTYEDSKFEEVRLRPCFMDSCLNFYRLGKHKIHIKST